jgi:hypothetical protein
MRVLVYVEGPSDRVALEALLRPLIQIGRSRGVGVTFHELGGKAPVLDHGPRKAAAHLHENAADWVFAVPDLYPMASYQGSRNAHGDFAGLATLMRERFEARADKLGLATESRRHFRVHCFKHDLEVLLLAAPEQLRARLKTKDQLSAQWRMPIEDQNDTRPPKRVVEGLFDRYRKKPTYIDTKDAPWILERANLESVVAACPQRFAPFVSELRKLAETSSLD